MSPTDPHVINMVAVSAVSPMSQLVMTDPGSPVTSIRSLNVARGTGVRFPPTTPATLWMTTSGVVGVTGADHGLGPGLLVCLAVAATGP